MSVQTSRPAGIGIQGTAIGRRGAAKPLAGFNTGFAICGVIMLAGGLIGMALMRPERDAMRWASAMPAAAVGPA